MVWATLFLNTEGVRYSGVISDLSSLQACATTYPQDCLLRWDTGETIIRYRELVVGSAWGCRDLGLQAVTTARNGVWGLQGTRQEEILPIPRHLHAVKGKQSCTGNKVKAVKDDLILSYWPVGKELSFILACIGVTRHLKRGSRRREGGDPVRAACVPEQLWALAGNDRSGSASCLWGFRRLGPHSWMFTLKSNGSRSSGRHSEL